MLPQPAASDDDLASLEQVISDGLRTFVEVGRALARIRDGKLYAAEHKTFEAYCQARWDMGKAYAHRLIASVEVVDNVAHGRQKLPPVTVERHARELAKLDPKEQPKAWAEAVRTAPEGNVTAKHVAAVVAKRLPEPPVPARPVLAPVLAISPRRPEPEIEPEPETDGADIDSEPSSVDEYDDPELLLTDLDDEIERRMVNWPASGGRFVAFLEAWVRRARDHFDLGGTEK